MSGGIYGIDDISPVVFDLGSHSFRAGYAGMEFPSFDIPSRVAVRDVIEKGDDTVDAVSNAAGTRAKPKKEYFLDTTMITVPRVNCDIMPFLKEGMIENWDVYEQMMDYVNNRCLMCDTKEHPVLFSEPPWNTREKREQIVELAFEKYQVPGIYLAKNAALTLFASGRYNGLVVDCGATHTSAVPVHDGYCMLPNIVHEPIGGDTIVEQCQVMLEEQNIEVVPAYKIAGKLEVGENEKPKWTSRRNLPQVTPSFEDFMKKKVIEDFAQSTLQLCETPVDIEFMDKLPASSYVFPCGFRKDFHSERAKIPESLFDLKYLRRTENNKALHSMNVSDIAAASCGMVEHDIRQHMYSNVYVSGGGSLIMNFPERLNHDLALRCGPIVKLRVTWGTTPAERRFGPWTGGSIVSCQPNFYHYWMTKAEYEEHGKSHVEKRCP